MSKKLHNIAASIILADAMRTIRNEFLVSIRGYLRPDDKDQQLITRTEHAMRQAIETQLSERTDTYRCPDCGSDELDFDAGNGGDQVKDRDGNQYQIYSATCRGCGRTVYLTAKYIGILNQKEFDGLRKNPTTSPFQ